MANRRSLPRNNQCNCKCNNRKVHRVTSTYNRAVKVPGDRPRMTATLYGWHNLLACEISSTNRCHLILNSFIPLRHLPDLGILP